MSKEKKIAVTFRKPWRGYNKGEIAGFDEEMAERLLDAGLIEAPAQAKGRREKTAAQDGGGEKKPPAKSDQSIDDQAGKDADDDDRP